MRKVFLTLWEMTDFSADHDIDDPNNGQLTIYNGRGLFIESTAGNIWL